MFYFSSEPPTRRRRRQTNSTGMGQFWQERHAVEVGLLNASAQERHDAAERQKNLSLTLLAIANEERDAKRFIWSNKLEESRASLAAANSHKEAEVFRKEEAQSARDKMRFERDLAQKRLDMAP
jgi:hypothetical protein